MPADGYAFSDTTTLCICGADNATTKCVVCRMSYSSPSTIPRLRQISRRFWSAIGSGFTTLSFSYIYIRLGSLDPGPPMRWCCLSLKVPDLKTYFSSFDATYLHSLDFLCRSFPSRLTADLTLSVAANLLISSNATLRRRPCKPKFQIILKS